jgi:hypothetical protein
MPKLPCGVVSVCKRNRQVNNKTTCVRVCVCVHTHWLAVPCQRRTTSKKEEGTHDAMSCGEDGQLAHALTQALTILSSNTHTH